MWDVSGVTGAAPVWRDMMDFLHKNAPGQAPTMPAGVIRQQIAYVPALEEPRNEFFLAGTERTKVELLAESKRTPKIRYPGNGSIIAIDPDIPDANQRIFFQAQSGNGLTWQLDEVKLGNADAEYSWRPSPGTHHLTIIDKQGKSIDSISFQVRGNYHKLVGTSPQPMID